MQKLLAVPTFIILMTTGAMAADVKAGQAAYDKSCKSCHGADGTPNAAIAKAYKVDMKDLKTADVQSKSDADIAKAITAGTGKMKPVAAVTGDTVNDVVAYVRSLKK
jgi:mono/diheme cytochrome c family protein